jgi:hypothetical protein
VKTVSPCKQPKTCASWTFHLMDSRSCRMGSCTPVPTCSVTLPALADIFNWALSEEVQSGAKLPITGIAVRDCLSWSAGEKWKVDWASLFTLGVLLPTLCFKHGDLMVCLY